jgi:hypothetical protein
MVRRGMRLCVIFTEVKGGRGGLEIPPKKCQQA